MPVRNKTHPTLIPPPSAPDHRAPIENVLELTQLGDIDPNLYTNTRPLWHPPGARGVFGGAVIAQTLAAAQHTVPESFFCHSMHCYFVMAGNAEIPIIFHVERVRDGRSYIVRTVQARQRGKVIFTVTMSFVLEGSTKGELVEHTYDMPLVPGPREDLDVDVSRLPQGSASPFVSQQIDILNNDSPKPHTKRTRQWIKARGTISEAGGAQAHLAAFAYMSDSYFIGTVSRVHKLWRIPRPMPREQRDTNGTSDKPKGSQTPPTSSSSTSSTSKKEDIIDDDDVIAALRKADPEERRVSLKGYVDSRAKPRKKMPQVGMMVSLDHTIYFHNPRALRADEWLFTEMESPWAGDGRGLVLQRVWNRSGTLVATCVQEGVVRLKPDSETGSKL